MHKKAGLLIFNRLFRGLVYVNITKEGYSPELKSLAIGSLAVFFHVRQRIQSRLSGDVGMRSNN